MRAVLELQISDPGLFPERLRAVVFRDVDQVFARGRRALVRGRAFDRDRAQTIRLREQPKAPPTPSRLARTLSTSRRPFWEGGSSTPLSTPVFATSSSVSIWWKAISGQSNPSHLAPQP